MKSKAKEEIKGEVKNEILKIFRLLGKPIVGQMINIHQHNKIIFLSDVEDYLNDKSITS